MFRKITLHDIRPWLVVLILTLMFNAVANNPTTNGYANQENSPTGQPPIEQIEQTSVANFKTNLPLLIAPLPQAQFFGAEIENSYYDNTIVQDKADDAGVFWVRVPAFSWWAIEPVRYSTPVYDWSSIDESALQNMGALGFRLIGTIKFTPSWAQLYPPDTYCGPVAEAYLDEFAQFVRNLVARYSAPPYNILYWEIGNEPDVDPSLIPGDSGYGCWGNISDLFYYGGRYYAKMLSYVYPAIKAANPNARVLIGGLLMDCDPTHPPPGKVCTSSNFFEGILVGGGAPYFDIVNFHGYAYYSNSLISDETNPNWSYRGGAVLGKINFLREVMAKYFVIKPIFHTEGSLLCHESNVTQCVPPIPEFYEAQADYVIWLYVRNWAQGLIGTIWYDMGGPYGSWRYASLLDWTLTPKPSYNALQFLTEQLRGGVYKRQITSYTGIRIYEFSARWRTVWIAWTPDEVPRLMTLPANVLQVLDKYGNLIQPVNGQITVKSPVYIERIP